MCSLSCPAPWAGSSLWVTPGSCWGHHACTSLWAGGAPLPEVSRSQGRVPGLLGSLPASCCVAALQAAGESLSWFASSCVGRAVSQGGEVSGIPGGTGVGAPQSLAHSANSCLPVSDLAWRLLGPLLASRLPSSYAGSQDLLLPFLAYFPWYLGVAVESPISAPTHLGGAGD